jgi:hypothetical protein
MKIVVIVLLFAVVVSLFSGLYFVYKDKGQSNRAVTALTIRIGLSLLVFAILVVSYLMGWIPQRG